MHILETDYDDPIEGETFPIFRPPSERDTKNSILQYAIWTHIPFEQIYELAEYLKDYEIERMNSFEKQLVINGVILYVPN